MSLMIDWEQKCKKIAFELAEDVCRRFFDNEEIKLNMHPTITSGPVYGRLSHRPLHDKWNTVIIEYSVIERKEIKLNKEFLQEVALNKMLEILARPDWQKHKESFVFTKTLSDFAEYAVGKEIFHIFSTTAVANPDKYPIWRTHGHLGPPIHKRIKQIEKSKNRNKSIYVFFYIGQIIIFSLM